MQILQIFDSRVLEVKQSHCWARCRGRGGPSASWRHSVDPEGAAATISHRQGPPSSAWAPASSRDGCKVSRTVFGTVFRQSLKTGCAQVPHNRDSSSAGTCSAQWRRMTTSASPEQPPRQLSPGQEVAPQRGRTQGSRQARLARHVGPGPKHAPFGGNKPVLVLNRENPTVFPNL